MTASDIVCQVLYPIAWCAGRRGDAAAIEQDDFTAFGQTVRKQGIPMVQAAAEMGDEEEWDARGLAPSAVSESVTIDFDEAGRRGQVGVGQDIVPIGLIAIRYRNGAASSSLLRGGWEEEHLSAAPPQRLGSTGALATDSGSRTRDRFQVVRSPQSRREDQFGGQGCFSRRRVEFFTS